MSELVITEMKKVLDLQKKLHIEEGPPSAQLRKDRIDRCISMVQKYQDQIISALQEDFGNRDPVMSVATEVMSAIGPLQHAKKNLVRIPIVKGTLPHQQKGKFGGARVNIIPAAPGTGVIAGGAVRTVLEAVGVNDVLSKSQGSSNPHNVVKATFDALLRLKNAYTIAKNRGITLEKLYKR